MSDFTGQAEDVFAEAGRLGIEHQLREGQPIQGAALPDAQTRQRLRQVSNRARLQGERDEMGLARGSLPAERRDQVYALQGLAERARDMAIAGLADHAMRSLPDLGERYRQAQAAYEGAQSELRAAVRMAYQYAETEGRPVSKYRVAKDAGIPAPTVGRWLG